MPTKPYPRLGLMRAAVADDALALHGADHTGGEKVHVTLVPGTNPADERRIGGAAVGVRRQAVRILA